MAPLSLLVALGRLTPSAAAQTPYNQLRLIAPAAPGGGWDQTARVMQQVMQRTGIARTVSVENIPGAAGLIGLARFIGAERGNGDALMVSGLIMLGAIVTQRSAVTLGDVTPIARLTGEYEVIVGARGVAVPDAGRLHSGVQGAAGGDLLGRRVGRRQRSDSGRPHRRRRRRLPAPRQLHRVFRRRRVAVGHLGGQVSVGVNGLAEFAAQIEAGTVRRAGDFERRAPAGLDMPTLREQGVDVEFENWRRSWRRPASAPRIGERLEAAVEAMVRSRRWREALERYRWIDRYLAGDAFARFVDAEEARVRGHPEEVRHARGQRRASLTSAGPYPMIVLAGLALCGLAAVLARPAATRRCRPAARGWRPIVLVALGIRPRSPAGRARGLRHRLRRACSGFGARVRSAPSVRDALFAVGGLGRRYLLFARVLRSAAPGGRACGLDCKPQCLRHSHGTGAGFANALTLPHLGWALVGVTLGTAVGVLPGIGPALTVAVLLPVTFSLDPISAFIMFGGIYYGAMYGGSTTSILLNTPGETGSIATAIDGYMMARQGRGAAALTTAAIGSFVAGTLATIALTFFAPRARLCRAALRSRRVLRADDRRVHGGVGAARQLARPRAVEPLPRPGAGTGRHRSAHRRGAILVRHPAAARRHRRHHSGDRPVRRRRDDVSGLALRARRDGGGDAARLHRHEPRRVEAIVEAVAARDRDRVSARRPAVRRHGHPDVPLVHDGEAAERDARTVRAGAIEGVAGPEAANNAAAAGVLVPLLTLGLPSSATAAVMLAAFQQYGLQPGPLLFSSRPDLVWTLIASLYIGNVMLLVLNLPLAGVWARVMLVPRPLLFGGILVLASLGAYT